MDRERQRKAEEAAQALLGNLPRHRRKHEPAPEWFECAMKKHTDTILARLNGVIVCDGCGSAIVGTRYKFKCVNCQLENFDLVYRPHYVALMTLLLLKTFLLCFYFVFTYN